MKSYCVLYRQVEAQDLALAVGSGDLPVLATPKMVSWMEEASCHLVESKEGFTSVGISLDIQHEKASLLGQRIQIYSHLKSIEGRIYTFEVSAYARKDRIGKGIHKRAIVNAERFMEKLEK